MDKNNISLEKLFLQFEAFNKSEGKTKKTLDWYKTSLYLFLDYLKKEGSDPTLGNVWVEDVREYILYLQQKERYDGHPSTPGQGKLLSPMTVQCYIRAIKAFFNWLYLEGYTDENRLERLKQPKAPKVLKDPLSEVEIGMVLSSIDSQTSWGARNSCIVLLLLDTGMRFSELLGIGMEDLHLEDLYVKVMGKGQKERIIPFGSSAQKSLMKYIYHFRPDPNSDNKLFLNLDGSPMTASGLRQVIERIAKSSGVERMHTHLLRHTFAVSYLMNGGDVFTLQQILGHTTLQMVRHYVNLANSHLMTQHKRFSPIDRMNLRQVNRSVSMHGSNRRKRRLTA